MSETNFEHYKEEMLACEMTIGTCAFLKKNILMKKDDEICGISCHECKKKITEWLKQPYKKPVIEIDWERVPIDTPVYVSDDNENPSDVDKKRYFCRYEKRNICKFVVFSYGATSFSSNEETSYGTVTSYKYCTLAREEDIEKYRKR